MNRFVGVMVSACMFAACLGEPPSSGRSDNGDTGEAPAAPVVLETFDIPCDLESDCTSALANFLPCRELGCHDGRCVVLAVDEGLACGPAACEAPGTCSAGTCSPAPEGAEAPALTPKLFDRTYGSKGHDELAGFAPLPDGGFALVRRTLAAEPQAWLVRTNPAGVPILEVELPFAGPVAAAEDGTLVVGQADGSGLVALGKTGQVLWQVDTLASDSPAGCEVLAAATRTVSALANGQFVVGLHHRDRCAFQERVKEIEGESLVYVTAGGQRDMTFTWPNENEPERLRDILHTRAHPADGQVFGRWIDPDAADGRFDGVTHVQHLTWERVPSESGFGGDQILTGGWKIALSDPLVALFVHDSGAVTTLTSGAQGHVAHLISPDGDLVDSTPLGLPNGFEPAAIARRYPGIFLAGRIEVEGLGVEAALVFVDPDGRQTTYRTFGGPQRDEVRHLHALHDGDFILAGETESQGAGASDLWLLRVGPDGASTCTTGP